MEQEQILIQYKAFREVKYKRIIAKWEHIVKKMLKHNLQTIENGKPKGI